MSIIVEHDKRKSFILEKSMQLFCKEGYEDVNLQKIAQVCGITRTTLYTYFKNKREIFLYSIKQHSGRLQEELFGIVKDESLNAEEMLRKTMSVLIESCQKSKDLFKVLLPYLISLEKSGIDPAERVRRRVIRLQHILSTIIIKGIKSGEFKEISVKMANELLYNLVQAAIFKLAVLNQDNVDEIRASVDFTINGFLAGE